MLLFARAARALQVEPIRLQVQGFEVRASDPELVVFVFAMALNEFKAKGSQSVFLLLVALSLEKLAVQAKNNNNKNTIQNSTKLPISQEGFPL